MNTSLFTRTPFLTAAVLFLSISAPGSAQTTERVSIDAVLGEPIQPSRGPTISGDGSLVAWELATFDNPNDGVHDIWIKNLGTGALLEVTAGATGSSYSPRFSHDGAWVTFSSSANLTGATGSHVYVYDVATPGFELVSQSTNSVPATAGTSKYSDVSEDGRHVAFQSNAVFQMTIPDGNFAFDVLVRDRLSGETTVLSEALGGTTGNSVSIEPAISDDGRFVAFESEADDLVAVDLNNRRDIFVVDRDPDLDGDFDEGTNVITLVSVNSLGDQALNHCYQADISGDGRYVVFVSQSTNLAPEPGGVLKVFRHDRDPDGNGIFDEGNGVTIRVDKDLHGNGGNGTAGLPQVSADGNRIAYYSTATNLTVSNGTREVYVFDVDTGVTRLGSVGHVGQLGNGPSGLDAGNPGGVALAGDGSRVAFSSSATNLVAAPDTNGWPDVYARDLCLGAACDVGSSYCVAEPNSTGLPGAIHGSGSTKVAENQLLLMADQLPPMVFGIFFTGQNQAFVSHPAGNQGNLCIGNPFFRFSAVMTDAGGTVSYSPDLASPPTGAVYSPGDDWNFQLWYRDVNPTPTSNFTDGLTVTFL